MKAILAVALLAVLGLTVAGCGSGKKANTEGYTVTLHHNVPSGPITVTGAETTAISNVKTGTRIRCKGWTGKDLRVPGLGERLTVGESVKLSGAVKTDVMSLTHRENGAITVACEFVEPR